jgi:hypothetical protein
MTAKFAFHHESNQIRSKIAGDHEYDVIDDELHDGLLATVRSPAALLQKEPKIPPSKSSCRMRGHPAPACDRIVHHFPYTHLTGSSIT